jgi:hypothetical protein
VRKYERSCLREPYLTVTRRHPLPLWAAGLTAAAGRAQDTAVCGAAGTVGAARKGAGVTYVIAVLVLALAPACSSMRPLRIEDPGHPFARVKAGDVIRVHTHDRADEIRRFERRGFDGQRTTFLPLGITGAVVVTMWAILSVLEPVLAWNGAA